MVVVVYYGSSFGVCWRNEPSPFREQATLWHFSATSHGHKLRREDGFVACLKLFDILRYNRWYVRNIVIIVTTKGAS